MSAPPVSSLLDLSGRAAIVTGASGGIGSGIALRLAEAGAFVLCHYNGNRERAEATVAAIRAAGGQAAAVQSDLSAAGGATSLIEQSCNLCAKTIGKPCSDILVNNAGHQPIQMLAGMAEAEWSQMLATNVTAPFLLTQAFAGRLAAAGAPGAVINIASIEAHQPAAGHAHYATSKAALLMFTRAAALEFGPAGIRVNSVSPGLIHRDGLEQAWPEGVGRWKAAAPLGRLGRPDDIADAVLFLASNAARWISGADLVVDGGVGTRPTW